MSNTWPTDLVQLCENAGVGTRGETIFEGLKAAVPRGDGPYLRIVGTGGSGPEWVHNANTPAFKFPAAQLMAVGKDYQATWDMINAAYDAVVPVRNQTIPPSGTVQYRAIRPLQEPFPLPLDDLERVRFTFNVRGDKAP